MHTCRPRRFHGDDGAATTEFVIVAPVLLLMMVLIVQFGLYFHASSVASAAAQEGAGTAAVHPDADTRIAHGEDEAEDFVAALAPELLTDVDVDGDLVDEGDAVRMTVTANVIEVFAMPGVDMDLSVTETAESIVEVFRPAGEAPPESGP